MYNPFSLNRLASIYDNPGRKRFYTGIEPPGIEPIEAPTLPSRQLELPQAEVPDLGGQGDSFDFFGGGDEGMKYFDELQRLRGQRGPALTAYQGHLQNMPTRESEKPGIGRKILGGIAAVGLGWDDPGRGLQAGQTVLDTPYMRATEDWSNKAKGLGESAKLEREELEGELKALSEARALGLRYDEYRLKQLEAERDFGIKRAQVGLQAEDVGTRKRQADNSQSQAETAAKRADIEERYRNGLLTAADKSREISKLNAEANMMNAKSNRMRAESAQKNTVSLQNYRTARLEQLAKSSGASPNELAKAMETSLQLMAKDPAFSRFIDTSSFPYVLKDPREFFGGGPAQAEYGAFNRELQKNIRSQIEEGKLLIDDGTDDGADEFEIGAPEF